MSLNMHHQYLRPGGTIPSHRPLLDGWWSVHSLSKSILWSEISFHSAFCILKALLCEDHAICLHDFKIIVALCNPLAKLISVDILHHNFALILSFCKVLMTSVRMMNQEGVGLNRRYECESCQKTFTKHCNLARHIQSVHEGVKYTCDQCDHTSTQKVSLIRHYQSLHEGVKYACDQWDHRSTAKSLIQSHKVKAWMSKACSQPYLNKLPPEIVMIKDQCHFDISSFSWSLYRVI